MNLLHSIGACYATALHKKSWALIERPYSCTPQAVGAVYDRPGFFVQSPFNGNSPPKLGGVASRTAKREPARSASAIARSLKKPGEASNDVSEGGVVPKGNHP